VPREQRSSAPPHIADDLTERTERAPPEMLQGMQPQLQATQPQQQNPNQTLAGVGAGRVTNPAMAVPAGPQITFAQSPAVGSEPPQQVQPLMPRDELSEVGARPLVEFKQRPSLPAQPIAAAPEDYQLRATNGWLIFAILLVLGVTAAITVIVVAG
jgi:hypothetical protein